MEQQIDNKRQAFVLRMAPSGIDRVEVALASDQIIIGWAVAKGLLDETLTWEEFRNIFKETWGTNNLTAGQSAGNMWRFIREMSEGDLVVVPRYSYFYVARVSGPATHDETKVEDDTAYRRKVNWLNDKEPIRRDFAKAALIARMKAYQTCVRASDLLPQIEECIEIAKDGSAPTFGDDLQKKLAEKTLEEIKSGRMSNNKFEYLVSDVLTSLGANDARVVARSQDKGADIVTTFKVAGLIEQTLAVQTKFWKPEVGHVGKEAVEQLIRGMEAESADLGMVITSSTFSEEAESRATEFFKKEGKKIELIDGKQLAKLIVEYGIKPNC